MPSAWTRRRSAAAGAGRNGTSRPEKAPSRRSGARAARAAGTGTAPVRHPARGALSASTADPGTALGPSRRTGRGETPCNGPSAPGASPRHGTVRPDGPREPERPGAHCLPPEPLHGRAVLTGGGHGR
ncbi:hypothetical protein B7R87_28420 [Streptomyces tsukubensis]|nr:hypothetical protein B7R87_28420 [Streptomyces tsukubensis]